MKTQTQDLGLSDKEMTLLEMLSAALALLLGKSNQGADMQGEAAASVTVAKPLQFCLMDNQGGNVQVISILPNYKG